MEVTPAGTQIQREQSATSESSSTEIARDLGTIQSLEKSSTQLSEEKSKVVEESTTQSLEQSRTVSASVTQSVQNERRVTQATFSSSSSFEASEANSQLTEPQNNPITDTNPTSAELDPGPSPVPLPEVEPLPPSDPVKARSPPKQTEEIEEGKIKNTLKEIISEIDHYVEKDDGIKETKTEMTETCVESGSAYENISKFSSTDYASEALKPELRTHQDMLMARLPSCLITTKGERPLSLPPETLMQLLKSVQIAQELNDVLKPGDTDHQEVSTKSRLVELFLTF